LGSGFGTGYPGGAGSVGSSAAGAPSLPGATVVVVVDVDVGGGVGAAPEAAGSASAATDSTRAAIGLAERHSLRNCPSLVSADAYALLAHASLLCRPGLSPP
jgi:hypothetical protein